jgi:hypothetical protein
MHRTRPLLLGFLAIVLVVLAGIVFVGKAPVYQHDPQKAAAAARTFARLALIEQDFKQAFQTLEEKTRAGVALEQFVEGIKGMHPHAFPVEVEPESFEPMLGQKAMAIYLRGASGGEKMYYRFVLAGDDDEGYRVSRFFRGSGPYPSSVHRKPL